MASFKGSVSTRIGCPPAVTSTATRSAASTAVASTSSTTGTSPVQAVGQQHRLVVLDQDRRDSPGLDERSESGCDLVVPDPDGTTTTTGSPSAASAQQDRRSHTETSPPTVGAPARRRTGVRSGARPPGREPLTVSHRSQRCGHRALHAHVVLRSRRRTSPAAARRLSGEPLVRRVGDRSGTDVLDTAVTRAMSDLGRGVADVDPDQERRQRSRPRRAYTSAASRTSAAHSGAGTPSRRTANASSSSAVARCGRSALVEREHLRLRHQRELGRAPEVRGQLRVGVPLGDHGLVLERLGWMRTSSGSSSSRASRSRVSSSASRPENARVTGAPRCPRCPRRGRRTRARAPPAR